MQIPDEIRKCVVFACFNSSGGEKKLAGTVFFVSVGGKEVGRNFGYAVTAKHVIVKAREASADGKLLLRVNVKQGPSEFIETNFDDWCFHPDDSSVDVAILPLWPPQDIFDFLTIPIEMAADDQVIRDQQIGIGDEVFLTGLFVNHSGRERNLPIVRTGNIALMPEERVQTLEFGPIDAVLVEARSIGGLSGCPVFVYIGTSRILGNATVFGSQSRFYWLGLMHGHWNTEVPGHDSLSEDIFTKEKLNLGIAIVVPVAKILEVINQEVLMKQRQRIIREQQETLLPTADASEASISKEAFEDALKRVSRRLTPSEPEQEKPET